MLWHRKQLKREDFTVARCTVVRLMTTVGIQGVRRGRRHITTLPDDSAAKPLDLVNRVFSASRPNQLWVADITYIATWSGFVYVAFAIDVFSRKVVGLRVMKSMQTQLILETLEQALWAMGKQKCAIHYSDRGSQYVSIRYSERLSEAGFSASVGSVGDSYDNALAETINGLYKAEVIYKDGSWKGQEQVELATLDWVDLLNNRRLLSSIDDIPPAEYEENYYRQLSQDRAA